MPSVVMSSRRLARRYGLLAFVLGVAIVGACATGSDEADFGDSDNTTAPTTGNVGQGGATAQTNGPATSGETDGAGGNGMGGSTGNMNMQTAQSTAMATQQSASSGFTSSASGFTSSASGFTSTGTGGMQCAQSADCNTGECCLVGLMICFQIFDPMLCLP